MGGTSAARGRRGTDHSPAPNFYPLIPYTIAGVDEAGRGPLAGPVVAAAVVLPADACIKGIDDSKKLTADQREVVYEALMAHPGVSVSACVVGEAVIDDINILQATMRAMAGAVAGLDAHGGPPDSVLIDGNRVPEVGTKEVGGRWGWHVRGGGLRGHTGLVSGPGAASTCDPQPPTPCCRSWTRRRRAPSWAATPSASRSRPRRWWPR